MNEQKNTAELLRTPIRRISFIYPPYGVVKNEPGLKAVKENYGVFPSLSLAYVAGLAEKLGYEIQFIDANALQLPLSETVRRVRNFKPDLLAFTITTYLFFQTLDWVEALREAVGVPTLLGGIHMGIYPEETFAHEAIDYGCTGEAEMVLPQFLQALNNGTDLSDVKGMIWRDGDRVVVNEAAELLKDVDSVPFPARNHLPNDRYYSFISQFRNFTPLITSRGCPFHCIFCEQGGLPFRGRSPDNVVNEIEECYHVYKVREFDFFDSSFTVDKKRVLGICHEIERRGIRVAWAIRSRVDLVDEELLVAMHGAGCRRIYYGIESSNPQILETLRKKNNLGQIREVMALTRKQGIDTFGYFLIGSPGETAETIKDSINFAISLKLDYAQFSKVTPMPATELYRMLLRDGHPDYWKNFIRDRNSECYVPRPGTDLTEDEIQRWTRKAYIGFYFRPRYILKALARLKSWPELKRSVVTAWSMLTRDKTVFGRAWTKKVQY